MNVEIRKLSPDNINDYLDFFDNKAFTDNHEWAGCYCVWYHWNDKLEAERKEAEASCGHDFNRRLAVKLIQEGTLQGYLAYLDNSVVGWCNTNVKTAYDSLCKEKWPEIWEDSSSDEKVKSIVCFTIAPDFRHMGIAAQLLNKACEDAIVEGYDYIEAYPGKDNSNIQRNYHGPYALYEKSSFIFIKEMQNNYIVRKPL